MQRVIIVPISDAAHFPGLEVIARDRDIAALTGPSVPGRSREAYESDEEFLEAVAHGFADHHTFATLDEAAAFAKSKLDDLARQAQEIEGEIAARKRQPPDAERFLSDMGHGRSSRRRA